VTLTCQGVSDVEDYHAEKRCVGAERAKSRARPTIARSTPAPGARRAALGSPFAAEAVLAKARPAPSGSENL